MRGLTTGLPALHNHHFGAMLAQCARQRYTDHTAAHDDYIPGFHDFIL
jgi:hypothetical protein